MNDGKRTLRLEIKVAPVTARAMEALKREMAKGDGANSAKFEPEDYASELVELAVLESFEAVFGAPAAIVFRQDTCVGERGPRDRR